MAKQKLLEDIKASPGRFYRQPADVMRDRRFADGERLEILQAWASGAGELAPQVQSCIEELQSRMPGHAAE